MPPITIQCERDYRTTINIRSHTVYADEPVDAGGLDSAAMPMEIFISTLGACVAVTARAYAQRKGWALEDINVEVEMERVARDDYPAYTGDAPYVHRFRQRIHFGGALTDEQKARLLEVATKCPVRRVLENPVVFTEELVEALPTPESG